MQNRKLGMCRLVLKNKEIKEEVLLHVQQIRCLDFVYIKTVSY